MATKQTVKVTDVRVGDLVDGQAVLSVELCQAWYEQGSIRFYLKGGGSVRRGIKEPLCKDMVQTITLRGSYD